ncbi:DUF4393 domain-containing protein [Vibrio harveyi]|uniref:DUF4393 domain-containing protein n=1 Tax=Vibrio harveyi TaxID=669 RepID=UPI00084E8593|nr:DUF4393 domain-containing protein [Vibrio harveyi]
MSDLLDLAKGAPKVVEEAYSDGVSDTLKEVSKIGVDAVKTIRLMLFPLQFSAMAQDRLAKYISKSMESIPEENRVEPAESLVLPLAEKLRYQEEDNPITDVYLNLLSRAMDRERVGEAHPAFVNMISQLCPDEVLLLNQIGKSEHFLLIMLDGVVDAYSSSAITDYVSSLDIPQETKKLVIEHAFKRDSIAQPELLTTFVEHLVSLGILVYDVNFNHRKELVPLVGALSYPKHYIHRLELTKFGQLFFRACVNCERFA